MHLEGNCFCVCVCVINEPKWISNYDANFISICRKYGIREDYQYSEILALCRFCCCLFWPSAGMRWSQIMHSFLKCKTKTGWMQFSFKSILGHPCIADQSPDYRARLKEAAGGDTTINEFQPVPPAQFLKYFSL